VAVIPRLVVAVVLVVTGRMLWGKTLGEVLPLKLL